MAHIFDQEQIDSLTERIVNALRPVGVTVAEESVQFAINQGEVVVMLMGLVREEAATQAQEAVEMKADLNRMLADQHRQNIADQLKAIKDMTSSQDALESALFGESCEHPNVHPEGFCIDCGEAVED